MIHYLASVFEDDSHWSVCVLDNRLKIPTANSFARALEVHALFTYAWRPEICGTESFGLSSLTLSLVPMIDRLL